MRLFQNFDIYPHYLARRRERLTTISYVAVCNDLHEDRFIALHMLKPTLEKSVDAAFSIGGDSLSQRDWAKKNGLKDSTSLSDILIAQIEDHKTEVFYNHDPMVFGSDFIRRLPGSVKKSIAWRAAPSPNADFEAYDAIVCNFPSILEHYDRRGWRSAYFFPAFDPVMGEYASNKDRDIDVTFAGTFSRHHRNRSAIIECIASLQSEVSVKICLLQSKPTRMANLFPDFVPFVRKYALPPGVRERAAGPVFGRDLYSLFSRSRIIINGAIDMSGDDRGNMRCFETLGCKTLLLSDVGNYPDGMIAGQTIATYEDAASCKETIMSLLAQPDRIDTIAANGFAMIQEKYSKARQWDRFVEIVS